MISQDSVITEFITTGVSDTERAAIGHIPVGRGILGVLIDDARPLRLHDVADDPRSVGFPANHPPMRMITRGPGHRSWAGVRQPLPDREARWRGL